MLLEPMLGESLLLSETPPIFLELSLDWLLEFELAITLITTMVITAPPAHQTQFGMPFSRFFERTLPISFLEMPDIFLPLKC